MSFVKLARTLVEEKYDLSKILGTKPTYINDYKHSVSIKYYVDRKISREELKCLTKENIKVRLSDDKKWYGYTVLVKIQKTKLVDGLAEFKSKVSEKVFEKTLKSLIKNL